MTALHKVDDRGLLISLLDGGTDFLGPAEVLDGLTAEQALAKPHNLPHSIAEIVAHMCFWQEWFNGCAMNGFTGIVKHAAPGWPAVSSDGWDALRTRFLRAIEEAKRIVAESDLLGESVCRQMSTFRASPETRGVRRSCVRRYTAVIIWGKLLRRAS